jgi:hypothetical protein
MKTSWIVVLSAAAAVSACGGGNDDNVPPPAPPVTQEVPPSASASVAGLLAYLKALVVAPADTLEPVDVSAVTPPSDDGIEPDVVD